MEVSRSLYWFSGQSKSWKDYILHSCKVSWPTREYLYMEITIAGIK